MNEDSTTILTNVHEMLGATESEASDRPASLVVLGGNLTALFLIWRRWKSLPDAIPTMAFL